METHLKVRSAYDAWGRCHERARHREHSSDPVTGGGPVIQIRPGRFRFRTAPAPSSSNSAMSGKGSSRR